MRVPGGLDSDSNRTLQAGLEPSRLSAFVFQTALHELARLRIYHRYLLVARVQIATYNHRRSAPFLRALVALSAPSVLGGLGADTVI